jgi:hypothetical protein
MVRIGHSRNSDAAKAARQCVAAVAGGEPVEWAIAFCGGKHDPHAFLGELRSVLGEVPIVGGSAAGVISREGASYSGIETAVAGFTRGSLPPSIVATHALARGESAAGQELGERVRTIARPDSVVILFYDSVAATAPLRLHPASPLVDGFNRGLDGMPVTLVGGGMLTDLNLSDGWVLDGTGVSKHSAVAVVLPPEVAATTAILHGCRPVSTFMEITRVEGAEIYELDGQPAVEVLERMLGMRLGTSNAHDLSLIATLGEKHGDPFAPYDENAYVNRLILRANQSTGSITIFEPDFKPSTRVQIMARDNGLMIESVRNGAAEMSKAIAGRDAIMALYIDCAGRGSARSGAPVEEADVMLESFTAPVPLIGFYSGVEIAPVNGRSRSLDWTAVLTVLHGR